jgi:hypothetical protein
VIEKLQDFPDNVAAYVCHGHLTKADYAAVIPHIQDSGAGPVGDLAPLTN